MTGNNRFLELANGDLLVAEADKLRKSGYRLAQACVVTKKEAFDILYSFVKGGELLNLRVRVADGGAIESITSIYPYAYLYENEMRDLHGVRIENIAVDFDGELYGTKNAAPFVAARKGGEGKA